MTFTEKIKQRKKTLQKNEKTCWGADRQAPIKFKSKFENVKVEKPMHACFPL